MSTLTSKDSTLVKDTIFPNDTIDLQVQEEIYIKTHHSHRPGEQLRRDYDWPLDPDVARFGSKGEKPGFWGPSGDLATVISPPNIIDNDKVGTL